MFTLKNLKNLKIIFIDSFFSNCLVIWVVFWLHHVLGAYIHIEVSLQIIWRFTCRSRTPIYNLYKSHNKFLYLPPKMCKLTHWLTWQSGMYYVRFHAQRFNIRKRFHDDDTDIILKFHFPIIHTWLGEVRVWRTEKNSNKTRQHK